MSILLDPAEETRIRNAAPLLLEAVEELLDCEELSDLRRVGMMSLEAIQLARHAVAMARAGVDPPVALILRKQQGRVNAQ